MADKGAIGASQGVAGFYRVGYPDLLEIEVAGKPELTGDCLVGLDGRIDLGSLGKVRVEGHTPREAAQVIAKQAGLTEDRVVVGVIEYHSQPLFLFGQVVGWQRTIPYQGQETILEVLQRVGGIAPGAAPNDVYLVRSHLADNQKPEVFHIDLNAIVLRKDQRTNIRVLPFDQIYVGETRRARFLRCIPPILRPLFHFLSGTPPPDSVNLAVPGRVDNPGNLEAMDISPAP